jgi:hypothetical protein
MVALPSFRAVSSLSFMALNMRDRLRPVAAAACSGVYAIGNWIAEICTPFPRGGFISIIGAPAIRSRQRSGDALRLRKAKMRGQYRRGDRLFINLAYFYQPVFGRPRGRDGKSFRNQRVSARLIPCAFIAWTSSTIVGGISSPSASL